MKFAGFIKNSTVALLTLMLAGGGIPSIAYAATPVAPSLTLTKNVEYLGDTESPELNATVKYTPVSGKYYRISIFETTAGQERYLTSCENLVSGEECLVSLEYKSPDPAGIHTFKAYMEQSDDAIFNTPQSSGNLQNVILESPVLVAERKSYALTLTTDTPFISTDLTSQESYPTVAYKLNQHVYASDFEFYLFDITNDKLLGREPSEFNEGTIFDIPQFRNDTTDYQLFLARRTANVNSVNDLSDVVTASNTVSKTRRPWSIEDKSAVPGVGINVTTINGGGDFTTYLADTTTNKIFWDSQEGGASMFAGYQGHEDGKDDWATAYVADKWETELDKPQFIGQLKNIRADSNGLKENIKAPGITDPLELAGGYNPSEMCQTKCSGDPINNFSGEFFEDKTDLSFAGTGIRPDMTRHFSTQLKDELGQLGYGWRNSYEMKIKSNTTDPLATAKSVKIINENGSHTFFERKSDGTYSATGKVRATLIRNSSTGEFSFLRNKRDTFVFGTDGLLKSASDINGAKISLSYIGTKLNTVTDLKGNTLTFAYNTAGNVITVTASNGRTVAYTYKNKQIASVKDERGVMTYYTYDTSRRVLTLKDERGGITTNSYNGENQVTQQDDPSGASLTFDYFSELTNAETTITHPDGKVVRETYFNGLLSKRTENPDSGLSRTWYYNYDINTNLTGTVNPDGSYTSAKYDSSSNMIESTNALGGKSQFTYDALGNVLTATNPLGKTSTYTYDAKGNMTSSLTPSGARTTLVWNNDGTLQSTTDPRGNALGSNPNDYKSIIIYNTTGLPTDIIAPNGSKKTTGYDGLGRITSTVSPRGNVSGGNPATYTSSMVYNTLDLPSKLTDPKGRNTALTYDNSGNVLTLTDADGKVTTNVYDIRGDLIQTTDALGGVKSYEYDAGRRVISSTDSLGKITTYTYDEFGQLVSTLDPLSHGTSLSYDSMGRVLESTDSKGNKTKLRYDLAGNIAASIDALGNINRSSYNKAGQLMSTTDAENKQTSYSYNDDGLLVEANNPDSTKTSYSYDVTGNVVSKTNSGGKTETWTYDSLNRKVSHKDAENRVESYEYDADSNMVKTTRRDGTVINAVYDSTNLITAVDYPGTDKDTTYGYDVMGRRNSESVPGSTVTTVYDALSRIKSRGSVGKIVSYGYDSENRNTSLTYPSGRVVSYAYDFSGNMKSLTSTGIGTISFAYDANNAITKTTLPNKVVETLTVDPLGRQSGILLKNSATALNLYKNTKAYTANGNLESTSTSVGTATPVVDSYVHDLMDRTTKMTSGVPNASGDFTYTSAGVISSLAGENVTANNIGQPSAVGTKSLGYDALGQRVTETAPNSTTRTLGWNPDGTLANVSAGPAGNVAANYEYSADGLISSRTSGANSDSFIWDSTAQNALLLSDGDYEYVYGPKRVPVAQVDIGSSSVKYLHTDQNGSVVAATDSAGVLASQTNYGAYGKRLGTSVSRFGFAGEWTDESTGYVFLRARWYDPATGVFLSEDPLVQATGEAYGYAGGNPLMSIDPSGLCPWYEWVGTSSSCYTMWDRPEAQVISDFAASYGDEATLGLTDYYRYINGYSKVVNNSSSAYTLGGAVSNAVPTPQGVLKAVVKNSVKILGHDGKIYETGHYSGPYNESRKQIAGKQKPNGTRLTELNHIPSKQWLRDSSCGLSKGDGLTILMTTEDHSKTRTWGTKNIALAKAEKNLSFAEVFNRDVADIRAKFGTAYDPAIDDLRKQYKKMGRI